MDITVIGTDFNWGTPFIQGAEARLYKIKYLGKAAIIKERFPKRYRHPELDKKITMERIRSEARTICCCKSMGINVPTVYLVDKFRQCIIMEEILNNETAKNYIIQLSNNIENEQAVNELLKLAVEIGVLIAKLHSGNIVHGDLTTSNILVKCTQDSLQRKLYLIDFGLSFSEASFEDKAVDMYVLERTILSTHSNVDKFFDNVIESYRANYLKSQSVLQKLDQVRSRGRKRTMVG